MLCFIEDFPDYAAHRDGSIWSIKSGTWKKLAPCYIGSTANRPAYNLMLNGEMNQKMGSHLILSTFVEPRPNGLNALHKDDDCTNDALYNLYWGTQKDNCNDRFKHGTQSTGENACNAKLSNDDCEEIKILWNEGETQVNIAEMYGVSRTQISRICRGKRSD